MIILAQLVDDVVANKFELQQDTTLIGRHPDCDIQIEDSAISGNHAQVVIEKNKYLEGAVEMFLEDLNSKNGTFLNGKRISGRQVLSNNDVIRFAWNEFKLIDTDAQSLEATALMLQQTKS